MGDLTHVVDSKLGQYGYRYDSDSNSYGFVFDYWTDPRFGQYAMYYNIIGSSAMRYKFKFSVDPTYGAYTFIYNPLEKTYLEDSEMFMKLVGKDKVLTDKGLVKLRRNIKKPLATIDSFTGFLHRLDDKLLHVDKKQSHNINSNTKSRKIDFEEFVSLLFYDSAAQNNISIIDKEFGVERASDYNAKVDEYDTKVNRSGDIHANIEDTQSGIAFEGREVSNDLDSSFEVCTIDMLAKIKSDDMLMENLKRFIEIEQEYKIESTLRSMEIEKPIELHREPYDIKKEDTKQLERDLLSLSIEDEAFVDRQTEEVNIHDGETQAIKQASKKVALDDSNVLSEKVASGGSNSIEIEDDENYKASKSPDNKLVSKEIEDAIIAKAEHDIEIQQVGKQLKTSPSANMKADNQTQLKKSSNKLHEDSNSEHVEDYYSDTNIHDYTPKLDADKKEVIKEVEERLNLHKRFWFLEGLGEVDYKILPNVDYKYPASIEIFKSNITNETYSYKYSDKFKELGSYRVRLYNEDLSIATQHEIIHLENYSTKINGVRINVDIEDINDDGYNYKVNFEVETSIDAAYMVITQPEGFMGNEYVFVATEKFLADNHPIPFGEDLGLREIPVPISIMVDFVNILLLLWAKRYLAFSGMTGTQSVRGMNELVYEWLTLDTSLEQAAIEDYYRCYRWFRWESEKVYNRAKQDPNLKGNRWIEEVVFEMIDYLEMHHFNKIPEWDDILRMDEQRNIFNSPDYDIPIVLDKFKGVRKRVMEKNKRYN